MNGKRGEAGVALIELLVASAIAALVFGLLSAAIYQFLKATGDGHDRLAVLRDHGTAFQWLNHDAQMAVAPLATAGPSGVTLQWTDVVGGTAYESAYAQSGDELVRTLTVDATPSSQTVARNLAPSGFSASKSGNLLTVSITSARDGVSQTRTETILMRTLAVTATPFATVAPTNTPTSTPTPTPTPTDTPTASPTPGCAAGDTGWLDPSAQAADSGGDGNGFELDPTSAFTDGAGNASNYNGRSDRHRYHDYGASLPADCPITGIEVRLDWWLDSLAGANSMSVELSWDGGTSWTAAQTDSTETTAEHTTILGGPTDTWGRSWTSSDLSDANFRVRLTSNSNRNARDFFLDWVPIRVHYAPATPTPAPTDTPTDTPTPTPTPTFTPTFTPTPTFTNTPTPSPTPTFTNTPTPTPGCGPDDTGWLDPSAQAADSGGDGNGFELNPTSAFTDGASNASNYNGTGDRHRYYDHGVSISSDCPITGIEVRLDWWLDSLAGANSMSVELSWDGGTSWTAAQTDSTETTAEHTTILGGPTDTWGRSWTSSDLSDANFRVRLTSNSNRSARDFFLDWVPIRIHFASPTPTPTLTPTNTPTPSPTPGCGPDDTGWLDPSAQAADSGGDGNGFELNPTSAFTDGASNASNYNGTGDRHRYYDYGVSISSDCSITGIEVRLDWWLDSIAGANSMSVELSWDGGTSWTAAQTDSTETTTEHTTILGGPTDTWGRSWTSSDLSNADFRVRLTSNSNRNARDFFLDWVPIRVHYAAPTPTPTPTFTNTPTPTPTPTCAAGDTGWLDPTAQAADSGGDGNGFELDPTSAFTDGAGNASNYNGAGDRHRYYDYGVSIPGGCSVTGIEVRLDWWLDSTGANNSMDVELSWDGGTSWTAAQTDSIETTTEHMAILGDSTDTWGRSWTSSDLNNASFRVRLTSNSSNANRDFFLDWVAVTVHYGP